MTVSSTARFASSRMPNADGHSQSTTPSALPRAARAFAHSKRIDVCPAQPALFIGRLSSAFRRCLSVRCCLRHSLVGLAVEGPEGVVPEAFRATVAYNKNALPFTAYINRSIQLHGKLL